MALHVCFISKRTLCLAYTRIHNINHMLCNNVLLIKLSRDKCTERRDRMYMTAFDTSSDCMLPEICLYVIYQCGIILPCLDFMIYNTNIAFPGNILCSVYMLYITSPLEIFNMQIYKSLHSTVLVRIFTSYVSLCLVFSFNISYLMIPYQKSETPFHLQMQHHPAAEVWFSKPDRRLYIASYALGTVDDLQKKPTLVTKKTALKQINMSANTYRCTMQ